MKNYDTNWDKVSAYMRKEIDSEPVYNNEFLKSTTKSYADKLTDLSDKKNS